MPKIQHIALFKWKPGTTPQQEAAIARRLLALKGRIPGLVAAAAGPQNSPEGLGKGFHFGLSMTFADAAARDRYLPHPEHQAVVTDLKAMLDDVLVLDHDC